jgi:hypothetical protein
MLDYNTTELANSAMMREKAFLLLFKGAGAH